MKGEYVFANKVLKAAFDSEPKALLLRPTALSSQIYVIVQQKYETWVSHRPQHRCIPAWKLQAHQGGIQGSPYSAFSLMSYKHLTKYHTRFSEICRLPVIYCICPEDTEQSYIASLFVSAFFHQQKRQERIWDVIRTKSQSPSLSFL